jgi:hypothetical protein
MWYANKMRFRRKSIKKNKKTKNAADIQSATFVPHDKFEITKDDDYVSTIEEENETKCVSCMAATCEQIEKTIRILDNNFRGIERLKEKKILVG